MKDQLLIVKKPEGFTSRDVINKLGKILGTKKVGHTGTLDPMATGVLVCLVGKYTKLAELITAYDKEYVTKMLIGLKTDTGDITGQVLLKKDQKVTEDIVKKTFKEFPKKYLQTVPKYSAVKVNGKKLYEYARAGEDIVLPQREVEIYSLELISFKDNVIQFKTKVSKGTYIRALIEDLAQAMGTVGTMKSLERTSQGQFKIEDAYTLKQIEQDDYKGLNIKDFLAYPVKEIKKEDYKFVKNGGSIFNTYDINYKVIFVYEGKDIAIYEKKDKVLKPYLMF